jgi:putative endonuclease
MKQYCVYILTNKNNTVLYTGFTSDLLKRIYQCKTKYFKKSFTSKFNCDKLVYFENCQSSEESIVREKQLKGGSRAKKIALINKENPEWSDLSEGWLFDV